LAFLEEEDPLSPDATARGGRYGPPDRQRQFLFRRLIAVAVGALLLILIVLGIRGCLNAREERALENYGRDLEALASESQQLSEGFFERLDDPGNLSELNFEAEVKADRGAAEGLVSRAEGLDPPGELTGAQADVVLAFELRRDGLAQISEQIGTALTPEGEDARDAIAQDMQYFVASDVLYRRGQAQIEQVFEEEGIAAEVPDSQFITEDNLEYLDSSVLSQALSVITGEEEAAGGGVHGLGLVPPAFIGDTELVEGTPVTATAPAEEVELSVQNQGDSEESEIPVTVEIDGAEAGEATIDTIDAGETQTVTIPLDPAPESGDSVTLDVFVEPVPGEQVSDNNEASYEVTFE
jgi:CARDB